MVKVIIALFAAYAIAGSMDYHDALTQAQANTYPQTQFNRCMAAYGGSDKATSCQQYRSENQ